MKENIYDNQSFFDSYNKMTRSQLGLEGAGEWHELKKMLPDFRGKRVLDLGCGYGWHCQYAAENGAKKVVGIDISTKMIDVAKKKNQFANVQYQVSAFEDYDYVENNFDIVISSLAFHYTETFKTICEKIYKTLSPAGYFIFSVEHPTFTAQGKQDWYYGEDGRKLFWPVDNYYLEGKRTACFLGENVTKYHRTVTTYIKNLLNTGFQIIDFIEPQPDKKFLEEIPEMKDELRRPMFLIISGQKK